VSYKVEASMGASTFVQRRRNASVPATRPRARGVHKFVYFNKVDKGGHFAAWEEPELFATELRAAFKSLR
jgi:pimeloyl-ACP methyl ester carboxylesterase